MYENAVWRSPTATLTEDRSNRQSRNTARTSSCPESETVTRKRRMRQASQVAGPIVMTTSTHGHPPPAAAHNTLGEASSNQRTVACTRRLFQGRMINIAHTPEASPTPPSNCGITTRWHSPGHLIDLESFADNPASSSSPRPATLLDPPQTDAIRRDPRLAVGAVRQHLDASRDPLCQQGEPTPLVEDVVQHILQSVNPPRGPHLQPQVDLPLGPNLDVGSTHRTCDSKDSPGPRPRFGHPHGPSQRLVRDRVQQRPHPVNPLRCAHSHSSVDRVRQPGPPIRTPVLPQHQRRTVHTSRPRS